MPQVSLNQGQTSDTGRAANHSSGVSRVLCRYQKSQVAHKWSAERGQSYLRGQVTGHTAFARQGSVVASCHVEEGPCHMICP